MQFSMDTVSLVQTVAASSKASFFPDQPSACQKSTAQIVQFSSVINSCVSDDFSILFHAVHLTSSLPPRPPLSFRQQSLRLLVSASLGATRITRCNDVTFLRTRTPFSICCFTYQSVLDATKTSSSAPLSSKIAFLFCAP